jgi:hypothetical protein
MPRRSRNRRQRRSRRNQPSGIPTPGTATRSIYTGTLSGTGTVALSANIDDTVNFRISSAVCQFVSEKPALISVSLRGESDQDQSKISPTFSIGVIPKTITVRQASGVSPVMGKSTSSHMLWLHNISGVPMNYNVVIRYTTNRIPNVSTLHTRLVLPNENFGEFHRLSLESPAEKCGDLAADV